MKRWIPDSPTDCHAPALRPWSQVDFPAGRPLSLRGWAAGALISLSLWAVLLRILFR